MLNTAYAGGLLSDETFASRLDQVLKSRLVDPIALVGDLTFRRPGGSRFAFGDRVKASVTSFLRRAQADERTPVLLALDWSGGQSELLVGRHHSCDVPLPNPTVSRRHARLVFRDGKWIVQDLGSTNGTAVNGTTVVRCELRPGDSLFLGDERLRID